jgi:hypothetical protein
MPPLRPAPHIPHSAQGISRVSRYISHPPTPLPPRQGAKRLVMGGGLWSQTKWAGTAQYTMPPFCNTAEGSYPLWPAGRYTLRKVFSPPGIPSPAAGGPPGSGWGLSSASVGSPWRLYGGTCPGKFLTRRSPPLLWGGGHSANLPDMLPLNTRSVPSEPQGQRRVATPPVITPYKAL